MSTQINQYLMYGISVPYPKHDGWGDKYESFMYDSAFDDKIVHNDGIFCLDDGMSGKYMIIGRVLKKSNNHHYLAESPIALEDLKLSDLESELIQNSVKRNFGFDGDFKTYLITHYR